MNMAEAFNEWMRRYIETPEQFEREWRTIGTFLSERNGGYEPSYGQSCALYLEKLMAGTADVQAST